MARKTRNASFVLYPRLGKGEDSEFIATLQAAVGSGAVWDNPPGAYFRLFHGSNTWDADHFGLEGVLNNTWCQRVRARSSVRKSKVPCSETAWLLHATVMAQYRKASVWQLSRD